MWEKKKENVLEKLLSAGGTAPDGHTALGVSD